MREKILKILNDVRPEFDFSKHSDFIEEGMLDSFDVISLVTNLESEFDVSIDGMDIVPGNFSSIEKITELINRTKTSS